MKIAKYNKKILKAEAIALDCRLLCLEGTARSSKTMTFSDVFYHCVMESNEKYHVIAGRDLDSIRNNILLADVVGMLALHPRAKLKKDKIGGYFVSCIGLDGKEKEIILVNYSNESSWKKILGMTLGVVYIDEINIANKNFVDECFARQLSADNPKTFVTLNGDDPNHWCYQEYINYCKMVGKIPDEIRTLMSEFQAKNGIKDNWYYMHFTMWDNPVMDEFKIQQAMSIFPKGSYYYNTKILGIRGTSGQLLFEPYMTNDLIVDAFEKDEHNRRKYNFTSYSFGADIGGGRAYNSIHLVGYERNYKRAVVLFEHVFQCKGYDKKKPIIFKFISDCMKALNINPYTVDGCLIDCAEQNFIADIKEEMYNLFRIEAVGSYKATIKERIDMMAIGFSTKRILFNTTCRSTYEAYKHAQLGSKAFERLDTNETNATGDNDRMDSCEYALTRHMKDLMSLGGNF